MRWQVEIRAIDKDQFTRCRIKSFCVCDELWDGLVIPDAVMNHGKYWALQETVNSNGTLKWTLENIHRFENDRLIFVWSDPPPKTAAAGSTRVH